MRTAQQGMGAPKAIRWQSLCSSFSCENRVSHVISSHVSWAPSATTLSPSMQHTYSPSGASFAPVYVSLCAWPTILAHNCFCICFPRRPSASCRKSLELPLHCPPVCCTVRGSRRHSIRAYFVHIFPTTSFIFLSAEMFLTRCCIFSASARHLGFSIFIPGPGLNVFTKETYYHLT